MKSISQAEFLSYLIYVFMWEYLCLCITVTESCTALFMFYRSRTAFSQKIHEANKCRHWFCLIKLLCHIHRHWFFHWYSGPVRPNVLQQCSMFILPKRTAVHPSNPFSITPYPYQGHGGGGWSQSQIKLSKCPETRTDTGRSCKLHTTSTSTSSYQETSCYEASVWTTAPLVIGGFW